MRARSKSQTRVSFAEDDLKAIDRLTREHQELMTSMGEMLASENDFNDGQRRVLDLVRAVVLTKDAKIQTEAPLAAEEANLMRKRTLTLYTLASHLTHECVKLSVEPSSVLQTFASLQRRTSSTQPPTRSSSQEKVNAGYGSTRMWLATIRTRLMPSLPPRSTPKCSSTTT